MKQIARNATMDDCGALHWNGRGGVMAQWPDQLFGHTVFRRRANSSLDKRRCSLESREPVCRARGVVQRFLDGYSRRLSLGKFVRAESNNKCRAGMALPPVRGKGERS
jgi:hypothetical protein